MTRENYTYLIVNKTTGLFYYGSRYSETAKFADLWATYFTSSKTVNELIEKYGEDDFTYEIRKKFDCPIKTQLWETRVIKKFLHHDRCMNKANLGASDPYTKALAGAKTRKQIMCENGLTIQENSNIKVKQTYKDNPDIVKQRTKKTQNTMNIIGEDGLTGYQRIGAKNSGDNNSSKRPETRQKIKESVIKWKKENKKEFYENIDKSKIVYKERGCAEAHSKWMKENNPTRGTIWVNNGKENLRVPSHNIPSGYSKGRIKFKIVRTEHTCPHCNFTGRGPNMKRYHFDKCSKLKK